MLTDFSWINFVLTQLSWFNFNSSLLMLQFFFFTFCLPAVGQAQAAKLPTVHNLESRLLHVGSYFAGSEVSINGYVAIGGVSQACVQTNDDNIEKDSQTEEITHREKWTQHPAGVDVRPFGGTPIFTLFCCKCFSMQISGFVSIDALHFLAGCYQRQLPVI